MTASDESASRLPQDPHPVQRTKLTPERMEAYLACLAKGMNRTAAAKKARISYRALQDYRRVDPAFKDAEFLAEQEAGEEIVSALWETAKNGNVSAQIFLATNLFKDRYKDMRGQKIDVNVAGKVELDAGPALERIAALQAKLEERKALIAGTAVAGPAHEHATALAEITDAEIVAD